MLPAYAWLCWSFYTRLTKKCKRVKSSLWTPVFLLTVSKQILLLYSHWNRSWEIWILNLDQSSTSYAAWWSLSYQGKSIDFVVLRRESLKLIDPMTDQVLKLVRSLVPWKVTIMLPDFQDTIKMSLCWHSFHVGTHSLQLSKAVNWSLGSQEDLSELSCTHFPFLLG